MKSIAQELVELQSKLSEKEDISEETLRELSNNKGDDNDE